MNKSHNLVLWITERHYQFPVSDEWENYDATALIIAIPFEQVVSQACEFLNKSNPEKYAVVSDFMNTAEHRFLNKKFLSNNIIFIDPTNYSPDTIKSQIEWIMSDFGREKCVDQTFFISDTHFGHSNIIKYCNRPWNSGKDVNGNLIVSESDVTRMDEELIDNWNSVVGKNSIVWHLGDFALGKNQRERIPTLVSRLNGKINLVLGNHDNHNIKFYYDAGFHRVYDHPVVIRNFFILSHSPLQWVKNGLPYANLYGHVHNQEMYQHCTKNTFNCCVETNGYKPITFSHICNCMENSEF